MKQHLQAIQKIPTIQQQKPNFVLIIGTSSGRNKICDYRWAIRHSNHWIFTEAPLSTANKLKEKYLVLDCDLTCKQTHLNSQ